MMELQDGTHVRRCVGGTDPVRPRTTHTRLGFLVQVLDPEQNHTFTDVSGATRTMCTRRLRSLLLSSSPPLP